MDPLKLDAHPPAVHPRAIFCALAQQTNIAYKQILESKQNIDSILQIFRDYLAGYKNDQVHAKQTQNSNYSEFFSATVAETIKNIIQERIIIPQIDKLFAQKYQEILNVSGEVAAKCEQMQNSVHSLELSNVAIFDLLPRLEGYQSKYDEIARLITLITNTHAEINTYSQQNTQINVEKYIESQKNMLAQLIDSFPN